MDFCCNPPPPLEKSLEIESYMDSFPGSTASYPQIVTVSNLEQIAQPPSLPLLPPPLPAPRMPLPSQKEESQTEEGVVFRVQASITKLKERCQSALKSLIWNENTEEDTKTSCTFEETECLLSLKEEGNLPILGKQQYTMEGEPIKSGSQGLDSLVWTKRLTDYQFLSGKDEEMPKRSTRFSIRAKKNNRRASVMLPQRTSVMAPQRVSVMAPQQASVKVPQQASVMVPQATRRSNDPGYKCTKCGLVVHRCCLNGVQRCEGRRRESPIAGPQPQVIRRPSDPFPGYGNLNLHQYAWWVKDMNRETATQLLKNQPEGTFLIRWSERHLKLVLSLKVAQEVKHMRILKHEETSSYYLSEVRYFRRLEGLVQYYRRESLSECFSDLFANLTRPLYEVAVANYAYESTARNYLSLEPGDTVIVISHDGENNGWWKGRIGNREGYFPKNFVVIQSNSF